MFPNSSNENECRHSAENPCDTKCEQRSPIINVKEDNLSHLEYNQSYQMFSSSIFATPPCGANKDEDCIAILGTDTCNEIDDSTALTEQEVENFVFYDSDHLERDTISPPSTETQACPQDENRQKRRRQGTHGNQVILCATWTD
jgi:hypothetical protein